MNDEELILKRLGNAHLTYESCKYDWAKQYWKNVYNSLMRKYNQKKY